jgi:hypothetical protein
MRPFKGLGSVIVFTAQELWEYHRRKTDTLGRDVARLIAIIDGLGKSKGSQNKGLQGRNRLPSADMLGAERVGGDDDSGSDSGGDGE